MFQVSNSVSSVSIVDFENVNISWVNDSNAEFFMLNFTVPFIENILFYAALIKDIFLFSPPKEFHHQLVRSVIIW